jgi:hypothetical protein
MVLMFYKSKTKFLIKQISLYFFLRFVFITFALILIPKHYNMENSVKKVASIQGAGTYEGVHGLLYSFDYTFEDESTLRANHKTQQSPFSPGDEVEVLVKGSKDGFSWGTVKRPDNTNYSTPTSSTQTSVAKYQDSQDIILNEWAIGRALEWEMNSAPPSEVNLKDAIALAQKLKSYALNLDTLSFGNSSEEITI